jgi:hypothetical protein
LNESAMSKRAHDGAESEAKVARRAGPLETLPAELIELFAAYSGPQGYAALAQTCRWMEAFLHEPARQRRLLDAYTTKVRAPCIAPRRAGGPWTLATITRHVLPTKRSHGPEEMCAYPSDRIMQRRHWCNGCLHGLSEYWRKDGSLRWVCEYHCNEPIRFESFDADGTRHQWPIVFDKTGAAEPLVCELWEEKFIELPDDV